MFGTIIASIIIFGILIFVHEFGHYIVARWTGVRVLEFSIGFGKVLYGWEKNGTHYNLKLFPLGGACRMLGEEPDEESDEESKEGSFQSKPLSSRFAVIAAGSFMNFLLGAVLFSLIYFIFLGVPQTNSTRIGEVLPGSRAEEAGLVAGDTILAIDDEIMRDWNDVVTKINANPGKKLELLVKRDKAETIVPVITAEEEGKGLIGIAPFYKKYSFFPSIRLGFTYTWFFIRLIFVILFQMFSGTIPADVTGPVGIVAVIGEVMKEGLSNLFSLAAIISVNLGIINLLPIPALDGSRLVFLVVEGIRGRPVDPHKEGFIHFIGFTVLILLMIFIAFQDIRRLFL